MGKSGKPELRVKYARVCTRKVLKRVRPSGAALRRAVRSKTKPRAPPACSPAVQMPPSDARATALVNQKTNTPHTPQMAQRLAAGRTLVVLQQLMRTSLFAVEGAPTPTRTTLQPARGLNAMFGNESVLIVDTFRRHGVWRADVAPIIKSSAKNTPRGAQFVLSRRKKTTCNLMNLMT